MQKNQLDSLVAMYDAGEIDRIALLNAQLDYHGAELSRLTALTDLQDALGRLEDALHYPLAPGTPSSTFPAAIPETTKDR
jgi:outer membrane protein TolC